MLQKKRDLILIFVIILFFTTGGFIDYWQSAMEHGKYLPVFLKDYFAIFWLILYTGVFPFLIAGFASNWQKRTLLLYFCAFLIGTVIWDVVYSLLDTGKIISSQSGYFFLKGKNFGLSEIQITTLHVSKLVLATIILLRSNVRQVS